MATHWQEITERVTASCAAAGFDLVQPFQVAWYNDAVDPAHRLADHGRARALGLLIGNTRALWPRLLAAVREDAALRAAPHPLDRYTVDRVLAALRPLQPRWEVRWSHERAPRRVAMQRLAHVSGLAALSPSFLNVHRVYGPWIALRAAVVLDAEGPAGERRDPPSSCPDCAHACLPHFERAAAALRARGASQPGLGDTWRLWLAVRDACPVGREHRYADDQIGYHYHHDRTLLCPGGRRSVGAGAGDP